ncbi:VOC family protein [Oricola sp.]|uniref:VOC family protein n=1 Tax=Oricola sp. TaxID=1979950 RepID=UPI0025CCEEF6|nr:VOC family protein [Oricola sp.]MCI5076444.1 VOC family protein [Oricola sp.]
MPDFELHHISVPTRDLDASVRFYDTVLELPRLQRPDFPFRGMWYACGGRQLHLIENQSGTFRPSANLDPGDVHFALRTSSFDDAVAALERVGYREDRAAGDPKRVLIMRSSPTGFRQLFLLDPDNHTIEINDAAM